MSTLNDRMIGEYKEYNMYANDYGMYYFYKLDGGAYFEKQVFDTILGMKDYIDRLGKKA